MRVGLLTTASLFKGPSWLEISSIRIKASDPVVSGSFWLGTGASTGVKLLKIFNGSVSSSLTSTLGKLSKILKLGLTNLSGAWIGSLITVDSLSSLSTLGKLSKILPNLLLS